MEKKHQNDQELNLELYAEELPEQINYSAACCWGSGGTFTSLGCVGSTASTSTTASTGSCVC
ncbi:thiocillin family RiPP [Alkalihalobacillus sp. R86527]|uniref:thiocillin family RiPP n=1 Tax=Alkalihalobacillus sp. R86527 TaxID=3093863 RepID=UPI00366ED785